jgi:hypothetical protein
MINFKILKKILTLFFLLPATFFAFLLVLSFINSPEIQNIEDFNLSNINSINTLDKKNYVENDEEMLDDFNYKLIGIRSGFSDSSIIVKKGSKEVLVNLGDTLDNSFELVEVNQNDALFRNGKKMYRIEKLKDK